MGRVHRVQDEEQIEGTTNRVRSCSHFCTSGTVIKSQPCMRRFSAGHDSLSVLEHGARGVDMPSKLCPSDCVGVILHIPRVSRLLQTAS